MLNSILGDPGAVSRVDEIFVVKVYSKIETSDLTVNFHHEHFSLFQVAIHHGCQFEICNWCNKVLYSEFMSSGMEKGIKYSQDQSSIIGIMLLL